MSGTLGGSGLHLCYYQKASEQVQVGVELETNVRAQESVASLGYQVNIIFICIATLVLIFLNIPGGFA